MLQTHVSTNRRLLHLHIVATNTHIFRRERGGMKKGRKEERGRYGERDRRKKREGGGTRDGLGDIEKREKGEKEGGRQKWREGIEGGGGAESVCEREREILMCLPI